jgi:hypothetical protein
MRSVQVEWPAFQALWAKLISSDVRQINVWRKRYKHATIYALNDCAYLPVSILEIVNTFSRRVTDGFTVGQSRYVDPG